MPIYEYQCRSCQTRLEKLQKLSDPPLSRCPECGEEALVKLVSAAAFRLKGGGWYETDFKKDGKRNLAGDDKAPEKKSDSGKEAPAAKQSGSTGSDAGASTRSTGDGAKSTTAASGTS